MLNNKNWLLVFFIFSGCATIAPSEIKQCGFLAEQQIFFCSHLSNGKIFYRGQMQYIDNTYYKNGFGEEYFKDGSIYRGGWKMGQRSGEGVYIVKDQTKCLSKWVDDRQVGKVICIYTGDYEGHIRQGLTNGTGGWLNRTLYIFPDGQTVEESWQGGKIIEQKIIQ
jgi:hypothetical protein